MEKNIVVYHYQNEQVELIKKVLRRGLFDYAATQACHDGQRTEPISENEFQTLVTGPIETKAQVAIDEIKKELNVAEKMTNAKQAEADAEKRISQTLKESNLLAHQRNSLVREKEGLPNMKPRASLALWLGIIAIVLGLIEGGISYESFKVAFPFLQAILMAVATGFVVVVSHPFGDWAAKAKTTPVRNRRITAILIVAAFFFGFFAFLRASSAASIVSVAVEEGSDASSHLFLSATSFFVVSFLLFAAGFFLSLIFHKSTSERENEQKHAALDRTIAELDSKQLDLKKKIKLLSENAAARKEDARVVFYYLERSIAECKSIAQAAIAEYKKSFAQQRDIVPDFFATPVLLTYDESLASHNTTYDQ